MIEQVERACRFVKLCQFNVGKSLRRMDALKLIPTLFLLSMHFAVPAKADMENPRPLPKTDVRAVQLVDGQFYCYGGWGTQKSEFRFDGRSVYEKDRNSPYLPSLETERSPKLNFGCSRRGMAVDFYFFDDAFQFQNDIFVDGVRYNSIDYEQSAILIGYSFPLVSHLLHIGSGLGYTQIGYKPGLYGKEHETEYSGKDSGTDGGLVYFDVRIFLYHFLFVDYGWIQSVRSDAIFQTASQLGLNFYRRF